MAGYRRAGCLAGYGRRERAGRPGPRVGHLVDGRQAPEADGDCLLPRVWEWLAVATAVCISLAFPWWLVAATVGYGLHLVSDQWFNRRRFWTYSLVYRFIQGRGTTRPVRSWDDHGPRRAPRQELAAGLRLVAWLQRRVRARPAGGA